MALRNITQIYHSFSDPIADLETVRPIPSPLIEMIDPFLFLNHHGPQVYKPNNRGLPFGPHPHRGFQTVTFIIDGDIAHRDSAGHESVIDAGGVQWMSAGRGLTHEEVSSEKFKKFGGPLEVLQLWINLPARLKMSEPYYLGLQAHEIPVIKKHDNQVQIQMISGEFESIKGPFVPSTDIFIQTIKIKGDAELKLEIADHKNIFFYVVRGAVDVNGKNVIKTNLVEFGFKGTELIIKGIAAESFILLCASTPLKEPVVSQGPFVMNTEAEIRQAIMDYQMGRFN